MNRGNAAKGPIILAVAPVSNHSVTLPRKSAEQRHSRLVHPLRIIRWR